MPYFSQILARSKKEGTFDIFASYTYTRAQEEASRENQGRGLCICKSLVQGPQGEVPDSTFIAREAPDLRYPRYLR